MEEENQEKFYENKEYFLELQAEEDYYENKYGGKRK